NAATVEQVDDENHSMGLDLEMEQNNQANYSNNNNTVSQHKDRQYIGNAVQQQNVQVEKAAFSDFKQTNLNQNEQRNLDMLLDIPLKVTVELGRTRRTIKEILELST